MAIDSPNIKHALDANPQWKFEYDSHKDGKCQKAVKTAPQNWPTTPPSSSSPFGHLLVVPMVKPFALAVVPGIRDLRLDAFTQTLVVQFCSGPLLD